MNKVTVVKSDEVEVKPFLPEDFISRQQSCNSMNHVSKKELKKLAESLGMKYTDEQIRFSKKLITAYINMYNEER